MRQCLQSGFVSDTVILQVYTLYSRRYGSKTVCIVQYAKLYGKFVFLMQKLWQQNGCAVSVCWDAMGYTEGTVAICKVVWQVCIAKVMLQWKACSNAGPWPP